MSRIKEYLENYTSSKSNVYIIPTHDGFKFIFINFTMLLISLSYANNMALIITFAMFSYLILQMLETHRIIQDLKPESFLISSQNINTPFHAVSHLKNSLPKNQSQFIRIELKGPESHILGNFYDSSNDKEIIFKVMPSKRGHYRIKRIKFYTYGSANLFYVWRFLPHEFDFFVYPKQLKTNHVISATEKEINLRKSGVEYQNHIPYVRGLTSKRIDWKIFARNDQLYWKKHNDLDSLNAVINYSALKGDKEEKIEKMSYLIDYHYKQNHSWKLILPNGVLSTNRGRGHYRKSLEKISVF